MTVLVRGTQMCNRRVLLLLAGFTEKLCLMFYYHRQGQAAWALQALTEGNAACQEDFRQSGGVASLTGLLRFPEQWNWTPAVGTLKNIAQGERPMTDALLADGAVPVLVDLLTFGRPILQVCGLPTKSYKRVLVKEWSPAFQCCLIRVC